MTRLIILACALLFAVLFGYLTASVIAVHGLNVGTLLSLAVIVLLMVGIVGALRNPPG